MHKAVNSFFITKVAAKIDQIVDPGEAAAAALAFASGPVAQTVIPYVGELGISALTNERIVPHTGATLRGKTTEDILNQFQDIELRGKQVKPPGQTELVEDITGKSKRLINKLNDQTFKVLNLFEVKQSPKKWWETIASPALAELADDETKALELIDSMIQKYKLPQKGVTVELSSGPLRSFLGPTFTEEKKIILPELTGPKALHEVGHAAHLTRPGAMVFKTMRDLIHKGTLFSIPMAYIAGNEIKQLMPGTLDDKVIDFVQKNAPVLMASTYAGAEIYPEVQATTRAVKHVLDKEGPKAARATLKQLLPGLATYLLPLIPTIVGLSLAKKYFFERQEKKSQDKTAGLITDIKDIARQMLNIGKETSYVSGQMLNQTSNLLKKPGIEIARNIYSAGKESIKSPSFAYGAVMAGIPALTATYVIHNTPHGKIYSKRDADVNIKEQMHDPVTIAKYQLSLAKEKKHHDSITFPAIVGLGAAVSGGFLTKFFTDMMRVL